MRLSPQPAASGRQVRTGFRQSIPSSISVSCAALIAMIPSAGDGLRNLPRSSRVKRHSNAVVP
jgi:hypothetical protein